MSEYHLFRAYSIGHISTFTHLVDWNIPYRHNPHPSPQLYSLQIRNMQLQHLIPAAFFSASALAATFNGFSDTACQRYDGTYIPVTAAQLQDLVVQEWATTGAVPEASRFLTTPDDKKKCPSNEDDTYKWVSLHDLGVLPYINTLHPCYVRWLVYRY
jgi:hypothetical protein